MGHHRAPTTVVRDVRILGRSDADVTAGPVDLLLRDGVVAAVGSRVPTLGVDLVLSAEGRWVAPGLWDAHVHLTQWARTRTRLDLRAATSVGDALRRLREHLERTGKARAASPLSASRDRGAVVVGFGHRSATWDPRPTVATLDEVCRDRPVVLVSGDVHHGWLNSRALELVGLPPRDGVVEEAEWFDVLARLEEVAAGTGDDREAVRAAVTEANARGVVGVVDFELRGTLTDWPARVADGIDILRVQAAVYADDLDFAFATGLRHGMPLPGNLGLVTLGPLKIISDGSLNTRTAYCFDPYDDDPTGGASRGRRNLPVERMLELMAAAHEHGMECAVHAIGDAAVADAVAAFAQVGARGSIEHAQLVRWADLPAMARLGLRASVQPAHLLDDREVTLHCWPDRGERCFALRSLVDAGIPLVLGSDAPVSPLDPWLAMAAAVHRGGDQQEPWHPEQALTPREAFWCSTGGHSTVGVGSVGDLVLLDDDPFADGSSSRRAARLRAMGVAATVVAGRVVHSRL